MNIVRQYQRNIVNHIAKNNSPISYIKNLPKYKFIYRNIYEFVNIPIQSKYYHEVLPTKLKPIINMILAQQNLNQKIIILEHLAQFLENDPKIILSANQLQIIIKQLKKWEGRKNRTDRIASVAWVIKKIGLQKQLKILFNQIVQRFQNDQWYPNFDQALKALQTFNDLEDIQIMNYIYPRIQRNLQITVWQFNMKIYQRMVTGLLKAGRLQSKLWDRLEEHIMKNLGMQYSLKTITQIFTCYAIAQKGHDNFFQMLQKVIYLGHWQNYDFKHRILPGYDQNGQFFALLVSTYSQVKKNCDIYLIPNFLDYIYQGVTDRKTNYHHLQSFNKIIQYLPGLFEEQDNNQIMQNLLKDKKPISVTFRQLVNFYNLISYKNIEVPELFKLHIQNIFLIDIERKLIPISKVIQMSQQLLQNQQFLSKNRLKKDIFNLIQNQYKYLQGQQARLVSEMINNSKLLPIQLKQKIIYLPEYRQSNKQQK